MINNTIQSTQQSLKIRLGSDCATPIGNDFQSINGLNLLIQDIQLLLLTIPGERVFHPEYGCGLNGMVWENFDYVVLHGPSTIQTALSSFEPRITVTNVDVITNEAVGSINFNIQFVVNSTNTPINLVYPFALGTQISFS